MYDPNPKGTLFLYNYISKSGLRPIELVGLPSTADFHPLGINFYREKAGGLTRLFVVNHQRNGSTVDIFDLDYDKAQAKFITSISDGDRNILSPNAIAPISYTSFYVTNDHRFISRLNRAMNQVETHLTLPLSWVTLVDFSQTTPEFTTVAKGIAFSNGIVLTPTGKEVIVASTVGKHLRVYDRDSKTNLLSLREKIPVPFMPDNLSFDDSLEVTDKSAFDKEGKFLRGLVSAGHPVPIKLLAVSRNPTKRTAPSWVVEVRRGQGSDPAPTTSMSTSWKGNYHLRTLYQSEYLPIVCCYSAH
jgi:arylesterase/paraoxonase